MGARPWYKRYPADFIAGTLQMSLEEKGAYSIVLDLIYDQGGPIPDDPRWIARVCGCSTRRWNQIRQRLLEMGKLQAVGGRLDNARAKKQRSSEEKAAENAGKSEDKSAEKAGKGAEKDEKNEPVSNENNGLVEKTAPENSLYTYARPQKLRDSDSKDSSASQMCHPPPPDELCEMVDRYNLVAARARLPSVAKLTAARRCKARQRLKDCGGLDGWSAALEKLEASAFLLGKNRHGWKADFDFLLQESAFTRLMEGSYDDRDGGPPGPVSGRLRPGSAEDRQRRRAGLAAGLARRMAAGEQSACGPGDPGGGHA